MRQLFGLFQVVHLRFLSQEKQSALASLGFGSAIMKHTESFAVDIAAVWMLSVGLASRNLQIGNFRSAALCLVVKGLSD
jgi:hypothetical protein